MNALLHRLGLDHPVILAPMGGGPGTPELAAAVSNAGGLGSLGVAYLTPEQIIESLRRTRALTSRPINLNLFAGGFEAPSSFDPTPMLAILAEVHAEFGLPAPTPPPAAPRDPFPDQFAAVLECRPEVFSFTFGALDSAAIAELRSRGIAIVGTATTVEEGRVLAESGVDAIVAQGSEAGAHRGTFAARFEEAMVPTDRPRARDREVRAHNGIRRNHGRPRDAHDARERSGCSSTRHGVPSVPGVWRGRSL